MTDPILAVLSADWFASLTAVHRTNDLVDQSRHRSLVRVSSCDPVLDRGPHLLDGLRLTFVWNGPYDLEVVFGVFELVGLHGRKRVKETKKKAEREAKPHLGFKESLDARLSEMGMLLEMVHGEGLQLDRRRTGGRTLSPGRSGKLFDFVITI